MAWYKGKEGDWITTDRGRHIFIPKGEDKDEYIKKFFDEEATDQKYEPSFDKGYKLYRNSYGYSKNPTFYDTVGIDVDVLDEDVSEILNSDLTEDQIKYKLGKLVAPDESRTNQYWIGISVLKDHVDEYNEILKERELKTFAPKIQKAEEYLNSIGKRFENWDKIPTNEKLDYANFDSNYNNYELSRKFRFNQRKYDMYTSNCQRCVMAWYLNMLGYDVEAMPYDGDDFYNQFGSAKSNAILHRAAPVISYDTPGGGTGYKTNWSYAGFNIPRNTKFDYKAKEKEWASTQYKNLDKMVSESANGSVYFCSVKWRGHNSAHVFIIYNDNGKAKFIDPQDCSDASKYFDKNSYALETGETTALRVNDFTLNGDTINQIVRKKGEAKRLYDEEQARDYKPI